MLNFDREWEDNRSATILIIFFNIIDVPPAPTLLKQNLQMLKVGFLSAPISVVFFPHKLALWDLVQNIFNTCQCLVDLTCFL